jgi:hypothetical protein
MYAVGLSVATWNVPTQYNISKYVIAASYTVAFGAILVAPLMFVVTDPFARLLLIGITVDSGVLMSVSIFSIPKLMIAMKLRKKNGKSVMSGRWWIFGSTTRKDDIDETFSSEKQQYENQSGIRQRLTASGNANSNLDQYDEDDDNGIQDGLSPWVAPLQTHSLTDENVSGSSPNNDSAICECADDYSDTPHVPIDNKRPATSYSVGFAAPSLGLRQRQTTHVSDDLALYGVVGNMDDLFISGRSPVDQGLVYCPNCVSAQTFAFFFNCFEF